MHANLLEISARNRRDPFTVADPSDFDYVEGPAIDPQVVITNPLVSLYCLDHANQRALFVETVSGVDLSQAPFFYQAQYENAVRLIAVPYDALHELANTISLDAHKVILVYSVGRTGSTLLGSALNAAEGIVGISEPDVFTQLVAQREWDGSNDAEISALVESCLKLLCKPTEQIPVAAGWVVKFRSFVIELGDLLYQHFPNTRNIFLYRNAESWLGSMYRVFGDTEANIEFRTFIQGWLSTLVPLIARHVHAGGGLLSYPSMFSKLWLNTMDRYMYLQKSGMPGLAIRYEDIKAAPQETLSKIFEFCGLPTASMEAVYLVLERDSQAGTDMSQDALKHKPSELSDAQRADLNRELQSHPIIREPDFILPATWMPTAQVG